MPSMRKREPSIVPTFDFMRANARKFKRLSDGAQVYAMQTPMPIVFKIPRHKEGGQGGYIKLKPGDWLVDDTRCIFGVSGVAFVKAYKDPTVIDRPLLEAEKIERLTHESNPEKP
jgi:hypothetical protein